MNNKKYDYLIVGAGLFGSTFARLATDHGKRCLVIDQRNHIGGNIYCEEIEGINVHRYGAHIFHTSNKQVWDFVNNVVPFNRYTNCPVAIAPDGNLYNLPFNMNTFSRMWDVKTPAEVERKLQEQRKEIIDQLSREGITTPRNLEEQALSLIGRDIYGQLIKGYTEKQWGRPCTELPAFIIKRLPVRMTFDNNYFNDTYQGIPIGGYNKLIEGLLAGSDVCLNSNFFDNRSKWEEMAECIVFTGRIDEFYNYKYGMLEYRSVNFKTEILHEANYQGNAVVNYTSADIPYTRIIEHKHFESFGDAVYSNPKTVISREFPSEWDNSKEPFYPVNNKRNQAIYAKYKELSEREKNVIFGGRLAEYKYYDMAPVIAKVFQLFND